jgi:hypothetical protein
MAAVAPKTTSITDCYWIAHYRDHLSKWQPEWRREVNCTEENSDGEQWALFECEKIVDEHVRTCKGYREHVRAFKHVETFGVFDEHVRTCKGRLIITANKLEVNVVYETA